MISLRIDVQKQGAPRFPFEIKLNGPVRAGESYRCHIEFDGWINAPYHGIKGNDSRQSLALAVQLVYSILCSFRSKGLRYYWPGSEVEFDLDQLLAPGFYQDEQADAPTRNDYPPISNENGEQGIPPNAR